MDWFEPAVILVAMFALGTPALLPMGLGAWVYKVTSPRARARLALGAIAAALASAATLWWLSVTIYGGGLRFGLTAGAQGAAVTATALLLGMAAAYFWKRGSGFVRPLIVAAIVAFIFAVGFFALILGLWHDEL
ncbi:MAG: hypothetical protein JNM59_03225 [Hyphomonadaceae bacterium]|nr:hypothetical protein [Hyphomonadaceae bacterium]